MIQFFKQCYRLLATGMNETKKSTSTIVTIAFLVVFFPVGLFLMWLRTQWPKPIKWIVTGIFALILSGDVYASSHAPSPVENQPVITKAPLTATKKPTPTPSYTPTPTRKPVYTSPTPLPASVTVTSIPTAPIVNSQQPSQTNNGATALCNDGIYSYAAHDQGACSHHQGVKEFYK